LGLIRQSLNYAPKLLKKTIQTLGGKEQRVKGRKGEGMKRQQGTSRQATKYKEHGKKIHATRICLLLSAFSS
jgi:hypothetical protein